MSGHKTPPAAKPKKGPLCWSCNRKFYANRCARVVIDGHVREVHAQCATKEGHHPAAEGEMAMTCRHGTYSASAGCGACAHEAGVALASSVQEQIVADLRAENERMEKALREIGDDRPEYFKDRGCGDGNCIVYRPEGQHTNGGCKCGTRYAAKDWGAMKIKWAKQIARAALTPDEGKACGFAYGPGRYVCDLPKGHEGDHEAPGRVRTERREDDEKPTGEKGGE